MSSPRSDLISSAIKFLQDPQVQQAPLAKRIAFLESKGLSQDEIQAALATIEQAPSDTTPVVPPASYPQHSGGLAQKQQEAWGWRDYSMAIVGLAGTGYGLFQLFQVSHIGLSTFPDSLIKPIPKELRWTLFAEPNGFDGIVSERCQSVARKNRKILKRARRSRR
jgi:hypothetical protein